MGDRPAEVEEAGIGHIPAERRHGSPGRVFTLWFGANLTVADYVIGVLTVQTFGLTVLQALPVFVVGNVLAGLVLGLSAAMGPSLGFPQMMSSRSSFGRKGNYPFGALNWVSTAGWFTVNTILGVEALQAVWPALNFYATATALVAVQVVIAVYGHDLIQLFEKAMSIVIGLLFLGVLALTLPQLGSAASYVGPGASNSTVSWSAVGVVLAASFSYLMSWSPYASDYSRYLAPSASRGRVAAYALAGGAFASFAVETVGALVGSLTPGLATFQGLYRFAGGFGGPAILAILLGVLSANALNIYTNSLSALVLDVRTKRWVTVVAGGAVGLALSFAGSANFVDNFQSFLLALDYWITPWLGIVLVDYFLFRRTTVDSTANPPGWDLKALGAYLVAVAVSVPFMTPLVGRVYPVGSLAYLFGGADFSYFVSFGVAVALTIALRSSTRRAPSGAP